MTELSSSSATDTLEGLRAELAAVRAELADKKALLDVVMDNNPDGIAILLANGSMITNRAGSTVVGQAASENPDAEWASQYGFFRGDRKTRYEVADLPIMRSMMRAEIIDDELLLLCSAERPEGVLLQIAARPLPGGGAISVFRDVTERKRLEDDLAARNESLAKREVENRELIERLRVALEDLSTPVLEVWEDVIVLPVVGLVDTQRSAEMSERLLGEVVRLRARHVIVDLTGVEVIDTGTADRFAKLARSVRLLGARCIVSGLSPAVAQTLVELGVQFGGLETERNLKHALESCMRESRETGRTSRGRSTR